MRVRFAPSPTGYLHVGGARTALYNYLFAKKHKGTFILRVEDTDLQRSTDESLRMQIEDLQWLGLDWEEGVHPETLEDMGEKGPYRQSRRLEVYKSKAHQLLESGQAYYCFLSDEEIEEQRKQAQKQGRPPQVQSPYKGWSLNQAQEKLESGTSAVIRFKTPEEKREYKIQDLVRGEVVFPSDMVGDFVLMRSNGMPVYNFCCALDDALMEITHVLRAEEHLSNTLRQLMILEALQLPQPEFGHLSIILGEDRQKLSKRHGATSVHEYKESGFLPWALNNFIALLGWSSPSGQEILSLEELIEQFTTDRLNPAAAVFDEKKLRWMNATYLRSLPHEQLWTLLEPLFKKESYDLPQEKEWQDKALSVFKTSMETLADAIDLFAPLSQGSLKIQEEAKEVLTWETTKAVVDRWVELVSGVSGDYLTESQFLDFQNDIKKTCEVKGKFLFMPIRVAIIGKAHGAELKQLVPLLKKETLLQRAEQVQQEM